MTPRRLDPATVIGKLRAMRRLLDELNPLGAVDATRFARECSTPLATEQYGEYVRQVARWVADRAE